MRCILLNALICVKLRSLSSRAKKVQKKSDSALKVLHEFSLLFYTDDSLEAIHDELQSLENSIKANAVNNLCVILQGLTDLVLLHPLFKVTNLFS